MWFSFREKFQIKIIVACSSHKPNVSYNFSYQNKVIKEFYLNHTHPQAIQDVDEFVSSSGLEKCSITSLVQQWILCSEWVPSEWESKQLIKTSQ